MTTQILLLQQIRDSKSWPAGLEEVVGVAVIALVPVVAGIRASERRAGLAGPAQGCADALARRVLGAQIVPLPIESLRTARLAGQVRSPR
jgi:hypothetical protein